MLRSGDPAGIRQETWALLALYLAGTLGRYVALEVAGFVGAYSALAGALLFNGSIVLARASLTPSQKVLRSRLLDIELQKQADSIRDERRGIGDRHDRAVLGDVGRLHLDVAGNRRRRGSEQRLQRGVDLGFLEGLLGPERGFRRRHRRGGEARSRHGEGRRDPRSSKQNRTTAGRRAESLSGSL